MKILFLGTHGQYNLGDELLLETFLAQLGPQHTYAVNSYDPPFTQGMMRPKYDVTAFHTTRDLPRFLRHLLGCDLLFFGGGSIIKELYASVGRNPYSTLLMILATVTFARRIAGRKVVMSNIGVGPLMTPRGEQLARWILNQVDFLSVRDAKSQRTAMGLGLPREQVRLVPDAVFANPPEVFLPPHERPAGAAAVRIALNLNYDIENRAAWEPFLAGLAGALRQLHAENPLELHALPMQSRFKAHDDLSVLKEFAARVPGIPFVVHAPQTAQEAARVMQAADLVLAERLHTLVIAAILGRPYFGLIYDVKVREMIEYCGMSEHSLDINQPFDVESLARGIRNVLAQRGRVGAHLLGRSAELRGQLGRYFDELKAQVLPR